MIFLWSAIILFLRVPFFVSSSAQEYPFYPYLGVYDRENFQENWATQVVMSQEDCLEVCNVFDCFYLCPQHLRGVKRCATSLKSKRKVRCERTLIEPAVFYNTTKFKPFYYIQQARDQYLGIKKEIANDILNKRNSLFKSLQPIAEKRINLNSELLQQLNLKSSTQPTFLPPFTIENSVGEMRSGLFSSATSTPDFLLKYGGTVEPMKNSDLNSRHFKSDIMETTGLRSNLLHGYSTDNGGLAKSDDIDNLTSDSAEKNILNKTTVEYDIKNVGKYFNIPDGLGLQRNYYIIADSDPYGRTTHKNENPFLPCYKEENMHELEAWSSVHFSGSNKELFLAPSEISDDNYEILTNDPLVPEIQSDSKTTRSSDLEIGNGEDMILYNINESSVLSNKLIDVNKNSYLPLKTTTPQVTSTNSYILGPKSRLESILFPVTKNEVLGSKNTTNNRFPVADQTERITRKDDVYEADENKINQLHEGYGYNNNNVQIYGTLRNSITSDTNFIKSKNSVETNSRVLVGDKSFEENSSQNEPIQTKIPILLSVRDKKSKTDNKKPDFKIESLEKYHLSNANIDFTKLSQNFKDEKDLLSRIYHEKINGSVEKKIETTILNITKVISNVNKLAEKLRNKNITNEELYSKKNNNLHRNVTPSNSPRIQALPFSLSTKDEVKNTVDVTDFNQLHPSITFDKKEDANDKKAFLEINNKEISSNNKTLPQKETYKMVEGSFHEGNEGFLSEGVIKNCQKATFLNTNDEIKDIPFFIDNNSSGIPSMDQYIPGTAQNVNFVKLDSRTKKNKEVNSPCIEEEDKPSINYNKKDRGKNNKTGQKYDNSVEENIHGPESTSEAYSSAQHKEVIKKKVNNLDQNRVKISFFSNNEINKPNNFKFNRFFSPAPFKVEQDDKINDTMNVSSSSLQIELPVENNSQIIDFYGIGKKEKEKSKNFILENSRKKSTHDKKKEDEIYFDEPVVTEMTIINTIREASFLFTNKNNLEFQNLPNVSLTQHFEEQDILTTEKNINTSFSEKFIKKFHNNEVPKRNTYNNNIKFNLSDNNINNTEVTPSFVNEYQLKDPILTSSKEAFSRGNGNFYITNIYNDVGDTGNIYNILSTERNINLETTGQLGHYQEKIFSPVTVRVGTVTLTSLPTYGKIKVDLESSILPFDTKKNSDKAAKNFEDTSGRTTENYSLLYSDVQLKIPYLEADRKGMHNPILEEPIKKNIDGRKEPNNHEFNNISSSSFLLINRNGSETIITLLNKFGNSFITDRNLSDEIKNMNIEHPIKLKKREEETIPYENCQEECDYEYPNNFNNEDVYVDPGLNTYYNNDNDMFPYSPFLVLLGKEAYHKYDFENTKDYMNGNFLFSDSSKEMPQEYFAGAMSDSLFTEDPNVYNLHTRNQPNVEDEPVKDIIQNKFQKFDKYLEQIQDLPSSNEKTSSDFELEPIDCSTESIYLDYVTKGTISAEIIEMYQGSQLSSLENSHTSEGHSYYERKKGSEGRYLFIDGQYIKSPNFDINKQKKSNLDLQIKEAMKDHSMRNRLEISMEPQEGSPLVEKADSTEVVATNKKIDEARMSSPAITEPLRPLFKYIPAFIVLRYQ